MYLSCVSGAAVIHRSLLDVVLRARARFFDTTPTGSVINRFSGDLNVVDRELPQVLYYRKRGDTECALLPQ